MLGEPQSRFTHSLLLCSLCPVPLPLRTIFTTTLLTQIHYPPDARPSFSSFSLLRPCCSFKLMRAQHQPKFIFTDVLFYYSVIDFKSQDKERIYTLVHWHRDHTSRKDHYFDWAPMCYDISGIRTMIKAQYCLHFIWLVLICGKNKKERRGSVVKPLTAGRSTSKCDLKEREKCRKESICCQ